MACTGCKKKTENTEKLAIKTNDSKFQMRSNTGVHQINFGSGLFISNDNLTDELALEFLKENPNRITLFESFPANWKQLLNLEIENEVSTENNKVPSKGSMKSKSK